jgi:hypothetical protein
MTYQKKENTYTLSTGRRFYSNRGIVGIDPEGREISEGYDGGIELVRDWDEQFQPWTPAERAELADDMIRRWTVFKDARPAGLEDRN